jgi:hypothetical protein
MSSFISSFKLFLYAWLMNRDWRMNRGKNFLYSHLSVRRKKSHGNPAGNFDEEWKNFSYIRFKSLLFSARICRRDIERQNENVICKLLWCSITTILIKGHTHCSVPSHNWRHWQSWWECGGNAGKILSIFILHKIFLLENEIYDIHVHHRSIIQLLSSWCYYFERFLRKRWAREIVRDLIAE